MGSTSDRGATQLDVASPATPAVALEDVWLRFRPRYYRKRLTLRGEMVRAVSQILRPGRLRKKSADFWALRGIELSVNHGEVLGVIGSNGAGKSTLLRVIAGIYEPDRGVVRADGSVAPLLSLGAGFDLRRPGRENIAKNATLLGLSKEQIAECMESVIETAGLGDFIDAPVMTYSSGMRARLGFSIAIHSDPDILLIDEVVGAGDERFRKRVGNVFSRFSGRGKTVVFVTHSLSSLSEYCTRAVWISEGKVRMSGAPREVATAYAAAAKAEDE